MGASQNQFDRGKSHATKKMQANSCQISATKAVQVLARRHKISVEYRLEKESGPAHAKLHTIRLQLGDKEYVGIDRSIKLAQHAAAQNALDNYNQPVVTDNSIHEQKKPESPTVTLNTWATQHHILTRYVLLEQQYFPPSSNHSHTIFFYRLYIGHELYFDGHGSSHQKARTDCAYHALNYIQQNEVSSIVSSLTEIPPKSQISLMYERAKQLGLPVRVEQSEPLTITYHIGDDYSTTVTGQTKHAAKENAAEKMLEILPLPERKVKVKTEYKPKNQHRKFIQQKGLDSYSISEDINPITRLYQIGRAREQNIEFIEIVNEEKQNGFRFQAKIGEDEFADGYGKNKQAAKKLAAENLLSKLNSELLQSITISLPLPPKKGLLKRDENFKKQHEKKRVHFVEDQLLTSKQQLANACEKLNIQIQYEDQIIADQFQSILSLSKDDRLLAKFRGNASVLVDAQENVSGAAWKNLHELFDESF